MARLGFRRFVIPIVRGISSNFVMGLDGRASFRELKGRAGGKEVSRSKEDRWLMDFLRAHHDGQLIGANTLREEPGTDARGADYGIDNEQLREYREQTLSLDKQKIIVLTGSGNIDTTLRVFDSPRVEPWIVTSSAGENNLRSQLKVSGRKGPIQGIDWRRWRERIGKHVGMKCVFSRNTRTISREWR